MIDFTLYDRQVPVVDSIVKAFEENNIVILEAPTGSGKSFIAAGVARAMAIDTLIITKNNKLQDAYTETLEIPTVYGKSKYTCTQNPDRTCKQMLKLGCDCQCYTPALGKIVGNTELAVTSHASYLSIADIDNSLLVVDEAHSFDDSLVSAASFRPDPSLKIFLDPKKEGIKDIGQLSQYILDVTSKIGHTHDPIEVKELSDELDSANTALNRLSNDEAVIEDGEVKPFYSFSNFERNQKVLFMSAHYGNVYNFAKMVGIESFKLVMAPKVFPPHLTPISTDFAMKINHQNLDEQIPHMAAAIQTIADAHKGQRGLVHTSSYNIAEKLIMHLSDDRFELTDSKEMMLDRDDVILLSPSMHTGVDFKDDLCRFNIIAKAPYMPLMSDWVKRRMQENPAWYQTQAKMKIQQSIGRSTRSEEDWSVVYILDANAAKLL